MRVERIQGRFFLFIDIIQFQDFITVQGGIIEHFIQWATMEEKNIHAMHKTKLDARLA